MKLIERFMSVFAVIVAVAVNGDGRREVLGLCVRCLRGAPLPGIHSTVE